MHVSFSRGLFRALAVCFLVASGSFALGETISFDDFSAPTSPDISVIGAIDPNPATVETTHSSIEGDSRDVAFDVSGSPEPVSFVGQVGAGVLAFNSSSPGTTATVTYDGLGNTNLNALGNAFLFDFLYIDSNINQKLGVQIEVWSGGAIKATSPIVYFDDSLTSSTEEVWFPVTGLTWDDDPSALGSASKIVVRLNPGSYEHIDFSLDDFGVGSVVVPEPSTAMLLIGGLLAAMVYVRRRR